MNNFRIFILLSLFALVFSFCKQDKGKELIEENSLGIIDANVKDEETNLDTKAEYTDVQPGNSQLIDRSFENAPPLIPHTTAGFFPIKKENNICLSCHMPDKIETSGAVQIPASHFTNLRPVMVEKDGVLVFADESNIHIQKLDSLNHGYFNCSQCHVPQADISVDIENLFTPAFREEYGINKSTLKEKLEEGLKNN